jgi:hypothetical protein
MRSYLGWPLLAPVALVMSCARADSTPTDAQVDATPIDAPPPIDAPRVVTLNQTDSQTVMQGGSVACNQAGPPQVSRENSYYRVFELDGWAIDRPFIPMHVDFGLEQAQSTVGSQPVNVKLYTLDGGTLALANLRPVSTNTMTIANSGITSISVPIEPAVSIPAHSSLVVEVNQPDGTAATSTFFIGANNMGESATAYLRAPDCGITEPTAYSAIGFPMVRVVLTITGTY